MSAEKSVPRWPFAVLAAVHMGTLFFLSRESSRSVATAAPGPLGNAAHVAFFGVLAVHLLCALRAPGAPLAPASWPGIATRVGASVLAVCVVYGVVDEVHQFYTGRVCSVFDVLLDGAGGALVLLVPLPGARGRPRTWRPFAVVAACALVLTVWGWLDRPWPDRVLERLLAAL